MGHIANRIFDLAIGQRPAAPVGKASALVHNDTQPAFHQIGIADLFRLADGHHRNLRIENGVGRLAGKIINNFHILPPSVEDFEDILIVTQQIPQGLKVNPVSQRINRGGFFLIGNLHQTEFGPIGIFAHEFGVDRNEVALRKTLAQIGQSIGSCNQIVYLHRFISYLGRSAAPGTIVFLPNVLTKTRPCPVSARDSC